MRLTIRHYELPLRHRFEISRGVITSQPALIVELEEGGLRGYGEATTNAYYGVTLESMTRSLESVRDDLQSASCEDPAALWQMLAPKIHADPFAQCALDQAAHDLWGKKQGQPVWKLWGLKLENLPPSNYTIGMDEIEVMIAKLKEFDGWPVYKIKLGGAHDLETVKRLREHTDAVFRVDANCGWTPEAAIEFSRAFRDLNVEFIEQPLPADQWDAMRRVYAESSLPVIADESCIKPADVDRCAECFHGVNIKLVKCGGLTPARRMIERARQLGLRTMVGCMTESTVGISAIAQLLPLLDYVDMDGAALLAEDIATGVRVDRGRCDYPPENGCGVRLIEHLISGAVERQ